MWSKESQSYVLSWVGTIITVIGLVLSAVALIHPQGFPVTPGQLAYIGGTFFLGGTLGLGAWRLLSTRISRPDIETLAVTKALTIAKTDGSDATLLRTEEFRVNRKPPAFHTLTIGGIAQTGDIAEIKIDGDAIPQANWDTRVNGRRVTKTKELRLKAGQTFTRDCEIRYLNTFMANTESLEHEASQPLRSLTLRVTFPDGRRPADMRTYLAYGGQPHEELQKPQRSQDGKTFTSTIKRPQKCGTYVIEWEW